MAAHPAACNCLRKGQFSFPNTSRGISSPALSTNRAWKRKPPRTCQALYCRGAAGLLLTSPLHLYFIQHDQSNGVERLLRPQGHLRVYQPVASESRRVSTPDPHPKAEWAVKARKGRLDQKSHGFDASLPLALLGMEVLWVDLVTGSAAPRAQGLPSPCAVMGSARTCEGWQPGLLNHRESVDPPAKQPL